MVACAPVSTGTASVDSAVDKPQSDLSINFSFPELPALPVIRPEEITPEELVFRKILTLCGLEFNPQYWDTISKYPSLPKLNKNQMVVFGNLFRKSNTLFKQLTFYNEKKDSSGRYNLKQHVENFVNSALTSLSGHNNNNSNNNNNSQSYIKFTLAFHAARQFIEAFNSMPSPGSNDSACGENFGFQFLLGHKFIQGLRQEKQKLAKLGLQLAESNSNESVRGGLATNRSYSWSSVRPVKPDINSERPKMILNYRASPSFLERLKSDIQGLFTGLFTGIKNFFIGQSTRFPVSS
jgi:hypothetical protein